MPLCPSTWARLAIAMRSYWRYANNQVPKAELALLTAFLRDALAADRFPLSLCWPIKSMLAKLGQKSLQPRVHA